MQIETYSGNMMMKDNHCAIMKKFFVKKKYRSQKVGLALYRKLLEFAEAANVQYIILDTPSVAHASHRFYVRDRCCRNRNVYFRRCDVGITKTSRNIYL